MQPHKSFANISDCRDLIQCAFSLNDFEIEVYKSAAVHGPIRADDLADRMGRDRSTVYRALQRLLTCGMVYRETRSLDKGRVLSRLHGYRPGRAANEIGELREGLDTKNARCPRPLR